MNKLPISIALQFKRNGEYENAIKMFSTLESVSRYRHIAECYKLLGMMEYAIEYYKTGLQYGDENSAYPLAKLFYSLGKEEEAYGIMIEYLHCDDMAFYVKMALEDNQELCKTLFKKILEQE